MHSNPIQLDQSAPQRRKTPAPLVIILALAACLPVGIAVVIAIQLTNASSIRGFETALDVVAGRTSVEISGTAGIPESRLADLGWLRELGAVSPVIEGEMAIVSEEVMARSGQRSPTGVPLRPVRRSEAVKVLGVDILRPPRDGHMAFIKSPDGHSVELLQKGASLPPQEPWASRPNQGSW